MNLFAGGLRLLVLRLPQQTLIPELLAYIAGLIYDVHDMLSWGGWVVMNTLFMCSEGKTPAAVKFFSCLE